MDGVFLPGRWWDTSLDLSSCLVCFTGKWKQRRAEYQLESSLAVWKEGRKAGRQEGKREEGKERKEGRNQREINERRSSFPRQKIALATYENKKAPRWYGYCVLKLLPSYCSVIPSTAPQGPRRLLKFQPSGLHSGQPGRRKGEAEPLPFALRRMRGGSEAHSSLRFIC